MMKQLIFTLLICLGVFSADAQKFGIKAGLNFANGDFEDNNPDLTTSSLTGFQLGLVVDFTLTEEFCFNTGLLYSQKGLKAESENIEIELPVNYLEIPLNLAYKYDLGEAKLFALAGPYAGIGLSIDAKINGEDENIDFGSGDEDAKRLDFGLNIGAGMELNALQVGINYGFGFTDLANSNERKMKNRVLSFTVGYFF